MAWAVAALVPPLLLACMVLAWGVDVPFWDQWDLLPDVVAARAGTLEPADLWRQHSAHRIPVPKAVMLALAQASGWDVRWEMGLEVVLAAALLVLLLHLARRTLADGPAWIRLPPVAALLSLLVFNPNQWQAWTWGIQLVAFLNLLGLLVAVCALAEEGPPRPGRLAVAALGCVAATLSFASGLLSWLAVVPQVASGGGRRWLRLAGWSAATAVTWWVYLAGYHGPGHHPTGVLETPRLALYYLLAFVGSPAAGWTGRWAIPVGLGVLAGLLWIVLRLARDGRLVDRRRTLPWLALALYVLLTAGLTVAGRLHEGVGQALSSRYITTINLLWAALVVLAAGTVSVASSRGRTAWRVVAGATAAMLLAAGVTGTRHFAVDAALRSDAARRLASGAPATELTALYPDADRLAARLELLHRTRLSLLGHGGAPPPSSSRTGAGGEREPPAPAGTPGTKPD